MTDHKYGLSVEIAHVMEHGKSEEAVAARVLRKFMCCEAGRNLVEHGILRPFGYTMTKREPVNIGPCDNCGHDAKQHIYEEGACRPGFVCGDSCERFVPSW